MAVARRAAAGGVAWLHGGQVGFAAGHPAALLEVPTCRYLW